MTISARAALMAGVATITATAMIAPSVQPPPPPEPTIQLAASSQTLQQQAVLQQLESSGEVLEFLRGILLAPGIGTPPPEPPTIPPMPVPGSVTSVIESAYLAIEPWVAYGFEVGAWAFGWVPYIGWLAPQIWPIGYQFGERLVRAIVFNVIDWLQGDGSFIDNVVDWGAASINALIDFGIDQWYFWIGFPLPPLPGIFTAAAPATTLAGLTEMPGAGAGNAGILRGLLDRVLNPVSSGGGLGGASLGSLFKNGLGGFGDLLSDPLAPPDEAKISDVSTIPSIVKTPFTPLKGLRGNVDAAGQTGAGPLAAVTKTVRNVRSEIRTGFNATNDATDAGNNVVRAQGARGPVGRAVTEAADALRGGKPNRNADDSTTTKSVAKSVGDTARKVVKDVRQADPRNAAKDRPAASADK
ncbi:hypothetical protein [Mycobacterium sp. ITM-2016-00318]|uniref:hypothetical protein n=1 Tax=Mycobacterium sp. ITM-2016-00318 TaxID=2099693 RepID=UPI001157D43A|nr:hypothetical protein [Mycobacterium sp. ITM-2016-00318]WNG91766.1 hypothetical protein C6A82_020210 [Mycobacterium sp. ITM-2016-00318]